MARKILKENEKALAVSIKAGTLARLNAYAWSQNPRVVVKDLVSMVIDNWLDSKGAKK